MLNYSVAELRIIFFFLGFLEKQDNQKNEKTDFSLAARIYKKEFSNLHPSPFYLTFYVSNSYG